MRAPLALLAVSVVASIAATLPQGGSDLLVFTLPCVVAALYLLFRDWLGVWQGGADAKARKNWVVVDGSNVMFWRDNKPSLATVQEVLAALERKGLSVGIVFDANVGHRLWRRYKDDRDIARMLGLPIANVLVVPKGTPADPAILKTAADLGARIVSNDRFRDWAEDNPMVTVPENMIRGGYRDGKLWLDRV